MATLSFSVFLEKLLDGSKTQTIREYKPYWKCNTCEKKGTEGWMETHPVCTYSAKRKYELHDDFHETTRLEVGDVVDIYWKQRVSFLNKEYYANCCGKQYIIDNLPLGLHHYCGKCNKRLNLESAHKLFQVKITEVFNILMTHEKGLGFAIKLKQDAGFSFGTSDLAVDLAKRDGFDDCGQMFNWFNHKQDISEPKEFVVYRWREVDGTKEVS